MKVAIGVRRRGDLGYDDFWISLFTLRRPKLGRLIPVTGYDAAHAARDIFRRFLKGDESHLLLLDNDAVLAAGTLERLLSRKLPVVGGLTFTRGLPPYPTIYRGYAGEEGGGGTWRVRVDDVMEWFDKPEIEEDLRAHQLDNAYVLKYKGKDALVRTDNIGFHCVLIERRVLEAVGEPFCEPNEAGAREDFDFSARCIRKGFDLYIDRSVFVGHIKSHSIRPFDFWIYHSILEEQDGKA